MRRDWKVLGAACGALLFTGLVWAAQEVMMIGAESDGTERRLLVDSSGRPITLTAGAAAHGACVNSVQTLTGTASNVPASPMSGRRSILLCNSESGETISCEADGAAAALATGIELAFMDCLVISISGDVNVSCISDGTSVDLRVQECP